MINVLFVCLGNICRSPMAEGILKELVQKQGLSELIHVDSAGTSGFHAGEQPDNRMKDIAAQHGILLSHQAKKLVYEDFDRFDYILSMDSANLDIILAMQKRSEFTRSKILMMRSFDPEVEDDMDVPDPYYGGMNGFENVYQMLYRSNEKLLEFLRQRHRKQDKTS